MYVQNVDKLSILNSTFRPGRILAEGNIGKIDVNRSNIVSTIKTPIAVTGECNEVLITESNIVAYTQTHGVRLECPNGAVRVTYNTVDVNNDTYGGLTFLKLGEVYVAHNSVRAHVCVWTVDVNNLELLENDFLCPIPLRQT